MVSKWCGYPRFQEGLSDLAALATGNTVMASEAKPSKAYLGAATVTKAGRSTRSAIR
jgi:hypothetical protein